MVKLFQSNEQKLSIYRDFIVNCTSSPNSAKNYSDFARLDSIIKRRFQDFSGTFECEDPDFLQTIYDELSQISSFEEFDGNKSNRDKDFKKLGSGQYHNTLLTYIRFLRAALLFRGITDCFTPLDSSKNQQIIYYGAPGTGKSYGIKRNHGITKENSFRTTFHPDSDYSTFVGCYKPIKEPNGTEITYDFVPQVFTDAYIKAWENYVAGKQIFLIIEEINRGNCAQIFGDLFQLLDRDEQGFSDYEIKPEKDLQDYLAKHLGHLNFSEERLAKIPSGKEMILPPNLNIIATMNTSDQSLFPIDSAFKRRWSWRYTAIKDANKDYRFEMPDGTQYGWWDFLHQVNDKIKSVTESEDKKMGYFFVRPNKKQRKSDERATIVTLDLFVSKVLFYLWTDIFKDYADDVDNNIFRKFVKKDENSNNIYEPLTFNDFFDEVGIVDPSVVEAFLVQFKLEPKEVPTEDEVEDTVITGKENCLVVTLPNGKVIQNDKKNNQTFTAVISEIAATVPGAIEILKTMKCGYYPLLSEQKLVPSDPDPKEYDKEKKYADQQHEFVVDGTTYYLHTKLSIADMRTRIECLLTKLYPDQVHPLEIGGYKVEMTYA